MAIRFSCICFIFLAFVAVCIAGDVLRPRGVSLAKASFYDPKKDFHCLDGSGTFSFMYVNDDYCDCLDGSDEPGTSACPNGYFYCSNIGHIPSTIPSSQVNDGICDCCDASEEYNSSANCVDSCYELGRAAREEAARLMEEQIQGYQLKLGMIQEGQKLKKEKEAKLLTLHNEKAEVVSIKEAKEQLKKEAELPESEALEKYRAAQDELKAKEDEETRQKNAVEAEDAFGNLDSDKDGMISLAEVQSKSAFDTNRDGEVTVEEAKFYLNQEETADLATFTANCWPLMRYAYKTGNRLFQPPIPSPDDFEAEVTPPPPVLDNADELEDTYNREGGGDESEHEEDGVNENEELDSADRTEDIVPVDEADQTLSADNDDDEQEEDEDEVKESTEIVYDEETQKLIDAANEARQAFEEAEQNVRGIEKEIRNLEESLEKDYGEQEEFWVLGGQCFEYTDREYTYKLCPFDKATQKSSSGHGETRLGQWGEWIGPEKYATMKYTNGQGCWNGPNRSSVVKLSCGIENRLTSVTEPSRCEYLFLLSTPAACTQAASSTAAEHQHIEL